MKGFVVLVGLLWMVNEYLARESRWDELDGFDMV